MKKLFMLLASTFFLWAIIACNSGSGDSEGSWGSGSNDASSTALYSYTEALRTGDSNKALEYVSESAQERQKKAFALMDTESKQRLADAMSRATKEYEDDFKIKYRFTMRLADESIVEDTFWLILEDGSWKIRGL